MEDEDILDCIVLQPKTPDTTRQANQAYVEDEVEGLNRRSP